MQQIFLKTLKFCCLMHSLIVRTVVEIDSERVIRFKERILLLLCAKKHYFQRKRKTKKMETNQAII